MLFYAIKTKWVANKMLRMNGVILLCFFLFSCGKAAEHEDTKTSKNNQLIENQTVVPSPEWQDQIIYFLMIDRFSDGNAANNDFDEGEFNPEKESHFNGGDLIGITNKLDYLQGLGATSVWITPPVKNLWWSEASNYGGYHGYWARDFKSVDPHFGSLEDYKNLSTQLHDRGMYLIQDIVLNHTAPLFEYSGEYNNENTAENFQLLGDKNRIFPTQAPFEKANRLNRSDAQANIYNWTPSIADHSSYEQQTRYQLGNLADLNTRSPIVLEAFKDTYKYWMNEVGVDAFRVDTAKYVEHPFWHHFFYDEDGIHAEAKKLGKSHFLTFGEVFQFSSPFQNNGEQVLTSYYGSEAHPEFNSVLGFPLYQSLETVFSEGSPTEQLAYRLQQHMQYPDPFTVVNFVDNHDVKRFLAAGSLSGFKQALSVIFTIPGIPVIYQGSEQAHKETRQAMFAGGYMSQEDQFNTQSEMYRFIQSLSHLRTNNKIMTRGNLSILKANKQGPGLLAYRRDYQGESVIVMMNSADHTILVDELDTKIGAGKTFEVLFSEGVENLTITNQQGQLNFVLPAGAILVLKAKNKDEKPDSSSSNSKQLVQVLHSVNSDITLQFDEEISGEVFNEDIEISGAITAGITELKVIVDGNLDAAQPVFTDKEGRFKFTFPINNLGETQYQLQLYAPKYQVTSSLQTFTGLVDNAEIQQHVIDANNDAKGFDGNYLSPQHEKSGEQREVLSVEAKSAGANLVLSLNMKQISHIWGAAKGFDNVAFSIYFNIPSHESEKSAKALPYINTNMPQGKSWSLGHILYGWGNYLFEPNLHDSHERGDKTGLSPKIEVDYDEQRIDIAYFGEQINVADWAGATIYISTWDMSGEGTYRDLQPEPGPWHFGGAEAGSPKVMDDLLIQL